MEINLSIHLVVFLIKQSVCMEGGRKTRVDEYPFMVEIEKDDVTRCIGIIMDHLQVIFPDGCLARPQFSFGYSSVYVVPVVSASPPKKYKGWFVIVASYDTFSTPFTGDFVIVRLEHPGMVLAPMSGNNNLPTRAPLSRLRLPKVHSDVIVVGLNRRVGAMKILGETGFHSSISSADPLRASLIRTKYILQDRFYCARNATESVADIPPGKACKQDVGAPVIQNGTVIGMVIHASCSPNLPTEYHVTHFVRLSYSDIPKEKVSVEL